MSAAPTTHDALLALERHFGHRRFLDGQEPIIAAILAGKDVLGVMPTGGGKSLCFQLPALVMEGVTVVISPLIALMKDQVDGLLKRGLPATYINSTLGMDEQRKRIDAMRRGEYKLVYIAPERFRHETFVNALRAAEIALFAVDEAHCISQWGHDFRPDYQRLHESLEKLGRPQVVAFTATATPLVREDIMRQLAMREAEVCVSGFARPNLSLNVTPCAKEAEKYARIRKVVETYGTGVIYCATRGNVEELTEELQSWGVSVVAYHAGLQDRERAAAQEKFISRNAAVAVATNAFGMGIDRPDVRFVIHFEIPGSLEAYYQEAGRAGRDGEPGWCELLFNYADTRTQEFFIEGNNPSYDDVAEIYDVLRSLANPQWRVEATIAQIKEKAGVSSDMVVSSALNLLRRAGHLERYDIPGKRMKGTLLHQPIVSRNNLRLDRTAMAQKAQRDGEKLKKMISWSYATQCRQRLILDYFGEAGPDCGNCDQCRAAAELGGVRGATAKELEVVRKLISGVARCGLRSETGYQGKYGRSRVIGMLTGSRSQDVLSAHLDELSTYGLLKDQSPAYLQALFRELEKGGLLEVQQGEFPLIGVTAQGVVMMKSGGPLQLQWPATGASAGRSGLPPSQLELKEMDFDEALLEKLKKKRAQLAKQHNLPASRIFGNQTLDFLTRLRPTSMEAASRIRGIAATKDEWTKLMIAIIVKHR